LKQELIKYLSKYVTDTRINLFDKIIQYRTKYITVVLEDIYQPHNASAVLRTCDCFGIQDVHIIENKNQYRINPDVTLGSNQWLTINKYYKEKHNTLATIKNIKSKGYRIIATTPHKNDVNLNEFDIEKGKIALFFGAELPGLSNVVLDNADEFVKIPMYGFTESYNISVSAAIILHHISEKLRNSNINWQLTENQREDVMLNWLKTSIKKSELIVEKFYSKLK
jgi:tRNA (guanosine-2'-O-)-methyltransferase